MNVQDAIAGRRSIRRFKDDAVPEEALSSVLVAASRAPSGKNRQPWRFVIVKENKRAEMIRILREGIDRAKARGDQPGSSEWTAKVMEQAPVTVFVFSPDALRPWLSHSIEQNFTELVDVQSVGAAIQNMLLTAYDLGLGTLWICDVFYAYDELTEWLGEKTGLIAAVSLGYPDESPEPRSRRPLSELVRVR
jgi:nitroreductase